MKLNDLKTGMWVKTRDGQMYLVMKNCETKSTFDDVFVNTKGNEFIFLKNYNENMEHFGNNNYNIVEVYKARGNNYIFDIAKLDVIWKREEELPKLSEFELLFLKSLRSEYKWITSDKDGKVYLYVSKPEKNEDKKFWFNNSAFAYCFSFTFDYPFEEKQFEWVKWEDKEPWYIPNLIGEVS